MSYDQGIDFRATSGFITDPASCYGDTYSNAFGSGNYPTTTPQGNNVGFENGSWVTSNRDRSSSVDARLAGIVFTETAASATYRFDLPAAGTYSIVLAAGDEANSQLANVAIQDTTTVLTTCCNALTTTGDFYDASGNEWGTGFWPGSQVPYSGSFSTTICRFVVNPSLSANFAAVAHMRVTAAGGGGNTYNVSVTETGSASDSESASAIFAPNISEAGSASDSPSALAVFATLISEAGSASDTPSASAIYAAIIGEAGNATDVESYPGGNTYNVGVSEAGSAADTVTATAVYAASVVEAGSANDAITVIGTFGVSIVEAGAATDAPRVPPPPTFTRGAAALILSVVRTAQVGSVIRVSGAPSVVRTAPN